MKRSITAERAAPLAARIRPAIPSYRRYRATLLKEPCFTGPRGDIFFVILP
jgi:hypothetical protein